jgi:hypothetical protein
MAARLAVWRRVTQLVWNWSFCTWWMGGTACLYRTVPVALKGAAQQRAKGIPSCCYIVNVHNLPSWTTSRKKGMAWYSRRPMPSLWVRLCNLFVLKVTYKRTLRQLFVCFYISICAGMASNGLNWKKQCRWTYPGVNFNSLSIAV